MSYQFPPDVEQLVQEQMAASGYRSEDDVLRDALRVFRELKARHDRLVADIAVGIAQANQGLARPIDIKALIESWTAELTDERAVD